MLASSHALPPPADTFDPPRPAVYRPRHPESTDFYRLFEAHFDTYRLTCEERFLERSGPLRPVVERTVEGDLECGRLLGGCALAVPVVPR